MNSLIAFLYAMLAQIMTLPGALQQQNNALEVQTQIATAQEENQILPAAQAYIQQYLSSIEATATASTPVTITINQLTTANIGANGLPNSFNSQNPYGQTWQIQVLQPSAGNLQALLIGVGGTRKLLDREAAAIASNVGIAGGFVPQNDSGIYPATNHVYGNAANYNITTTGYQNITGGQPAALLVLNNGQQQNLYLYRVAVPGQPQVNEMFTGLNMGNNAITNANGVQTAGGSNAASVQVGQVYYYGDASGNAAIRGSALYIQNAAGTAPANIASVGNINSSGSVTAAGNVTAAGTVQGGYLYSTGNLQVNGSAQVNGNVNAGGNITTGNTVQGGYVNSTGNVNAQGYVTVQGGASPGGGCGGSAVGNGPSGTLLCESGVWSTGGYSSYTTIGWYYNTNNTAVGIGWYKFCWISGINGPNNNGGVGIAGQSGNLFYWTVENNSPDSSDILVSCMS